MDISYLEDFEDEIKNAELVKDWPFGLSFHDAEILKMELKNGDLTMQLSRNNEKKFATIAFKNATIQSFALDIKDPCPAIIFKFEVEKVADVFNIEINFCISEFSQFAFSCKEISIEEVFTSEKLPN